MYFLQFRAGRSTTETTINNPPGTTNIKRKCTITKIILWVKEKDLPGMMKLSILVPTQKGFQKYFNKITWSSKSLVVV